MLAGRLLCCDRLFQYHAFYPKKSSWHVLQTVRAELSRSMNGLQHIHLIGESKNPAHLSTGLRANGILGCSIALFMVITLASIVQLNFLPQIFVKLHVAGAVLDECAEGGRMNGIV